MLHQAFPKQLGKPGSRKAISPLPSKLKCNFIADTILHQLLQFPLLGTPPIMAQKAQKVSTKSGVAVISSFPLREYWYYLILSRLQYSCKRTQDNKRKNPEGCHSRIGAHFLSHSALQPTEKTENLDACIKTIIPI